MFLKNKKFLLSLFLPFVFVFTFSCSIFQNNTNTVNKTQTQTTEFTTNTLFDSGKYADIYDLSFSLIFSETDQTNQTTTFTFGTAWLLDWKDEFADNNYFKVYLATNLHVAQALKNPNDYEQYTKLWNTTGATATSQFYIGKYEDSITYNPNNSVKTPNFISYQTSSIPKTAWLAIDFVDLSYVEETTTVNNQTKTTAEWKQTSTLTDAEKENAIEDYADFAVLELTLLKESSVDMEIYNTWITPAIETYKTLASQQTNATLFATSVLKEISSSNYFIGGYPATTSDIRAYYLGQNWNGDYYSKVNNSLIADNTTTKSSSTSERLKELGLTQNGPSTNRVENGSTGTLPVWTVNQKVNTTSEVGSSVADENNAATGDLIKYYQDKYGQGVVPSHAAANFVLEVHEQEYKQFGYVAVLAETNLAGGSSGSIVLNNNEAISGIYYGTLAVDNQESDVGLVQLLAVNNASEYSYDLIFGTSFNRSYYDQFAKTNNTYLASTYSK